MADDKYNGDETHAHARQLGFERLFLHAEKIIFPMPSVNDDEETQMMTIEAPLPDDLAEPLSKIKKVV